MHEPTRSPYEAGAERTSWYERELVLALQRLANARANVALLEHKIALAGPGGRRITDPERHEIERRQRQIERLRVEAAGRFGGRQARHRLVELQTEQHERLRRLGVNSFEQFTYACEAQERLDVDRLALDVARTEALAAERNYAEVSSMPVAIDEVPALGPGAPASPRLQDSGEHAGVAPFGGRVVRLGDRRPAAS
jgi:hypothetical protein